MPLHEHVLDPLDNGTLSLRNITALALNGANGDADGDTFTNLQELTNGTNPREDNAIPPPPPGQIKIGPQTPVVAGGVSNNREFTDWGIHDLVALDEYQGDGTNNQGGDLYRAYDGFDSSRDMVAFYAHDGGAASGGGDDLFYFRADFQDLKALAEEGNLDLYVVIDFGNPESGESALPDEIDTRTNMKWEAVVACYSTDNGAIYVDTNTGNNTTAINEDLTAKGVVRRSQFDTNGFNSTISTVIGGRPENQRRGMVNCYVFRRGRKAGILGVLPYAACYASRNFLYAVFGFSGCGRCNPRFL